MPANAILLLSCPDQRGVVAAVAEFVARHGGNIVHAEQHTDVESTASPESVFFQRVEFELDGFDLPRDEILPAFSPVVERFGLTCELRFSDQVSRVAVLASKQPHCLYDLLTRWRTGELAIDVPLVISNHDDHAVVAERFDVPYRHLPVDPGGKARQEAAVQALARRARRRSRGAGALHAGAQPGLRRSLAEPGDQHPPLVPARPSSAPGRTTRPTNAGSS